MHSVLKQFLEEYIELIETEDWNKLFQEAAWEKEFSELQFIDLVKVLNSIGCNTQIIQENFFIAGLETYYDQADDWMAPEDILNFYSTCGSFGIDYERRCALVKEWIAQNPGKLDWHWDVRDHSNFEVLCIEDN